MIVEVNGEPREFDAQTTVARLIEILGIEGRRVAVEVNREIVPRSLHAGHVLEQGDRVEVVTMVGGG